MNQRRRRVSASIKDALTGPAVVRHLFALHILNDPRSGPSNNNMARFVTKR